MANTLIIIGCSVFLVLWLYALHVKYKKEGGIKLILTILITLPLVLIACYVSFVIALVALPCLLIIWLLFALLEWFVAAIVLLIAIALMLGFLFY